MAQLLFEDVPLVNTEVLGDYQESALIPHHYGDLRRSRVRCLRISSTRFLVGAHPWLSVDEVFVGGSRISGWVAETRVDVDGVNRQYVLTDTAVQDNYTVEVAGRGKVGTSGKLLENPDEIIQDIAALAGKTLSFPLFREACNRRALVIAGSVYEAKSVRYYIKEICDSCGSKWLADNILFFPPAPTYATPILFPSSVEHSISTNDVAGVVGVFYGWNHSRERNGGYIELAAPGSAYTNKGIYYAKWLRKARDAEEFAQRMLSVRAGEFVKTAATVPGLHRAGSTVYVESPTWPGSMVIETSQGGDVESQITGTQIISQFTNLKTLRYSSEVLTRRGETVEIAFANGEAVFTVLDIQGRAMPGILIALDNSLAKTTNAQGQAIFTTTTGPHELTLGGNGIDPEPFAVFVK